MNPRTYRHTSSAQQLPEANQGRVPLSGYPEDIQDLPPQAGSAPARVVRQPRSRQEKTEMEEGMDVAVDAFEDEILA